MLFANCTPAVCLCLFSLLKFLSFHLSCAKLNVVADVYAKNSLQRITYIRIAGGVISEFVILVAARIFNSHRKIYSKYNNQCPSRFNGRVRCLCNVENYDSAHGGIYRSLHWREYGVWSQAVGFLLVRLVAEEDVLLF
jgi:hypothetical protein